MFSGCTFKEYKGQEEGGTQSVKDLKASSNFAYVNGNILSPKCLSCHAGANPSAGVDLSSCSKVVPALAIPGNPEGSKLYQVCGSGQMPKGMAHLTAREMQIIYEWIKNGAKEIDDPAGGNPQPTPVLSPTPVPSPTPFVIMEPTFPSIQKNIFTPKCVTCHSGYQPSGKIDMTTHSKIMRSNAFPPLVTRFKPRDSNIYLVVKSGAMPKDKPHLPQQEIQAIYDWIKSGAAEDGTVLPEPSPVPTTGGPGCDEGEPGCDEGPSPNPSPGSSAQPASTPQCDVEPKYENEPGYMPCIGN